MIKKFIFRNVAQSFTKARQRSFAEPIAKRDMAAKIAARTEGRSHRILTKKVESAFARSALKPGKANQFPSLVKQKTRALTKAFTLSQKRGIKTFTKATKKLGVTPSGIKDRPVQFYRQSKRGLPEGMTTKQMGWAPEDPLDVTQKAFYMKGLPKAKLKKHRATLSKIYATKKGWKDRAHLKSVYRARAKAELGAAKLDRSIYRTQTIQKQTGTTKRGKPIWKTIWKEPKREFKKWTKE